MTRMLPGPDPTPLQQERIDAGYCGCGCFFCVTCQKGWVPRFAWSPTLGGIRERIACPRCGGPGGPRPLPKAALMQRQGGEVVRVEGAEPDVKSRWATPACRGRVFRENVRLGRTADPGVRRRAQALIQAGVLDDQARALDERVKELQRRAANLRARAQDLRAMGHGQTSLVERCGGGEP